ncbi:MAG: hypothetical protein GXN94_05405 [Aquificae bacterium]|nr:hypothetical protein [Aquificota bacterium]
MFRKAFLLLWIVFVLQLISCGGGGEDTKTSSTLIEAQAVAKLTPENVSAILNAVSSTKVRATSFPQFGPFGLVAFKVVYWTTDENGEKVKASGLVVFPDPTTLPEGFVPPIVSDQHGTIFHDSEAPTNAFISDIGLLLNGGMPTSSTFGLVIYYTGVYGFALSMPDYIGYGSSVDHYHTYMMENSLANATVDLLKASLELAETMGFPVKREVYLAGYSEGGYATLSTAKRIETDSFPFTLKGSFPMAGVYDLETMGLAILSSESMVFPPFPAYVVYAYSQAYPDVVLSQLVNPPFDTQMAYLFDKTKDGMTIYGTMFAMVNKDPTKDTFLTADLFTQEAMVSFLTNPDYPFRVRLRENNVDDWSPKTPVVFIHCGGDNILPQNLAYATYQKFLESGSPVQFIDPEAVFGVGPLNHSDCGVYAYQVLFGTLCQMEYGSCY